MNGAPDFETIVDRIVRLRRDLDALPCWRLRHRVRHGRGPGSFTPDKWVAPPNDRAPTGIQKGKGYGIPRLRYLEVRVLRARSSSQLRRVLALVLCQLLGDC